MQETRRELSKLYYSVAAVVILGAAGYFGRSYFFDLDQISDGDQHQLAKTIQEKYPATETAASLNLTKSKVKGAQYSAATQARLEILETILKAKNDNDPRIDSAFNDLTDEDKGAIASIYSALPLEARNERGLLILIMSKNLKDGNDFRFINEVFSEPACLGLANCSQSSLGADDEMSLIYPQMVALKQFEKMIDEQGQNLAPGVQEEILRVLKNAENFDSPRVQDQAKVLGERLRPSATTE